MGRRFGRPSGRRVFLVAALAVVLLVVAAGVAAVVPVPYYAVTPGTGLDVARLISVPRSRGHDHLGKVLLTDVELTPLHALSYLYFELDSNAKVLPSAQLVGSASASQYEKQGEIDMFNARQAATVVALHALGYATHAVADGVTVYQTTPGSPGAGHLHIGDVIVAVDAHLVSTIAGLVARLGQYRPGASVLLTTRGLMTPAIGQVRVQLGEVRVEGTGSAAADVCTKPGTGTAFPPLEVHGSPAACLAVAPEQAYRAVGVPFHVKISSGGIIGPSAGLAFTLGLIERLDAGDLAAGITVAATGTMSVAGVVGDVGGVAQKTIAVRAAGASVFFVPPAELSVAQANAGPDLKVLAVSSISQAITDLEQLGGRLVPSVTTG